MTELVSCLMVTRDRLDLVRRAVLCFQAQSYPHRELVVVVEGDDGTREHLDALGDRRILLVRPEQPGLPLGALRNIAVSHASGGFVAQWDDDDWSHPDRLALQMMTLIQSEADVCLLERWTLAWPARNLFYRSKRRPWEGTILARKNRMPAYPDKRLGEDTELVEAARRLGRKICLLDRPDLYIYAVHGRNSFPVDHFTRNIFNEHTGVLAPEEVADVMRKLQHGMDDTGSSAGRGKTGAPAAPPSICVLIPVHNQAKYLFRAVASVVWQLEPQDELVLVDDASSDIEDHAGLGPFLHRILWLANPSRRGVSFSRNHGIIKSRADWIKPLDADDILAPYALEAIRKTPPLPEVVLVTGGCHRIHNGRYLDYLCATEETIQNILHHLPTLPSATFIRRQALLEVGMFDPRLDLEEDWDMWLRLHERYGQQGFAIVQQPLCYYWIDEVERQQKKRQGTVEGVPVREYFRQRYGADPR